MGVPRTPIQLELHNNVVLARGVDNPGLDVTNRLIEFASEQSELLHSLDGFILKSRSPSCGTESVKLYSAAIMSKTGTGIFARTIMQLYPALPVASESNLTDSDSLINFIDRVTAYQQARMV